MFDLLYIYNNYFIIYYFYMPIWVLVTRIKIIISGLLDPQRINTMSFIKTYIIFKWKNVHLCYFFRAQLVHISVHLTLLAPNLRSKVQPT